MLLFSDVLTGDEMISDAYDLKDVDDVVYEADCAMITIREGQIDTGANASAEEAEEELQEGESKVNNVVNSFRLASTQFDKKSYMTYLKGYMKAIKAHLQATNPDRVPVFEKAAAGFAKKVLGNFGDYEFYTGESMNPDGMVALLNYREDGTTPYFIFWKDGMKTTKLSNITLQRRGLNNTYNIAGAEWVRLHCLLNQTNHLYLRSIDALGRAMKEFQGGVVIVSHDFRLISVVAEQLWEVKGKKIVDLSQQDVDILKYKRGLIAAKEEEIARAKMVPMRPGKVVM